MTTPHDTFVRLMALSEVQEILLRANPGPFLARANKEVMEKRKAVSEAIAVLTGFDELLESSCSRPLAVMSPSAVDRQRILKALEILRNVR